MDEKKLKEVITRMNERGEIQADTQFGQDVLYLIDLADRYLDLKGFPEELNELCSCGDKYICGCGNKQWNRAIQLCKLAHLEIIDEKLEGVEHIINMKVKEMTITKSSFDISGQEELSDSIKAHFRREND